MNHNFLYFFTHTVSIRQNKIYSFVQSAKNKNSENLYHTFAPQNREILDPRK